VGSFEARCTPVIDTSVGGSGSGVNPGTGQPARRWPKP